MQRSAGNQAVTSVLQDGAAVPTTAGSDLSSGMALDPATRQLMESRLGHDFGTVRVHAGEAAARSARHLEARAFTIGEDIVLGADAPPLHSKPAEGMLAHELTHVVQQRRGGSTPGLDPGSAHEGVAAAAATAVTSGHAPAPVTQGTAVGVARQGPGDSPPISPLTLPTEGVDMPWTGKGAPSSELGYLRDKAYFWTRYQAAYGDQLSPTNRALIAAGRSPVVDDTWVRHHRQHGAYLGDVLEHHHVGQGSRAVPIPESLHDAYTVLHPQRRVVGTQRGGTKPLPPQPTPQRTVAEIRRHTGAGRIRGEGISPGSPPAAPGVPVSSEVAAVPRAPRPAPTAAPAATTAPSSPAGPPASSGTETRIPRPPGPGTRRPIRGGRFKPAVTTVEREADSAWRRMTRSSAAAIAKEAAPSTSRWAKAGRGLGKVAGVGFKAIGVVAPIAELMGGLAQIEEAKAMLSEIAKQQEEAYIAVMRDQGYEPVYRNGKLVDFKSVQPTPVTPAPSMEPTTGRVYSLRGQTLVSERVRLSSGHEPITFASLTDEGSNVWDLSQPRRQILTGYASRKDRAKLKGLAQMQAGILRMAHARSQQAASPTTEAPEAPAAVRGNLKIDFYWREGGAEKSIEAVCDNRSSPEGSWVASTLVGSVDELRAASRDQPLLDYEMDVLYTAADGSESSLHVVQSSSGNSVEKGDVPAGVLELGKYPDDSAVNFIIETYWYE